MARGFDWLKAGSQQSHEIYQVRPEKKPNAMRCNLAKLTFEYKSKFRSLKAREAIWIIYLRYDKKNQSIQLKENCDVMRFELHSTTHTIASVTQSDCVKVTTTYVILIRNGSAGGETSVVYTCSYSYIVVRCLGDITQSTNYFIANDFQMVTTALISNNARKVFRKNLPAHHLHINHTSTDSTYHRVYSI